jgi:hypothetical protein
MSERLFVSTRKGLFELRRGAAGWSIHSAHFLGDPVTLCLPDARDGAIYAALELGHFGAKLHRSDDGGKSFREVAVPAYPKQTEGLTDADGMGSEWPWKLIKIWALEAGLADQAGVLWAGTIPGGLFRSDDRGESWQLNRPLWDRPERKQWFGGGADHPGLHSVCVHPSDGDRLWVGVSCGGTWHSADGGESWELLGRGMFADYMPPERREDLAIQDPHCIVQSRSDPEVLWCQHHNGAFVSEDGARSWRSLDVPPSVFGFAVAVHPTDPRTAWFVPAVKDECRVPVGGQVVVSRTRDGGETFEVLREGLPQQHAYDLVYRHALAVDGSGEGLAFGSTTGALWISEDSGDAWQEVSAHLPPIHAVRFG